MNQREEIEAILDNTFEDDYGHPAAGCFEQCADAILAAGYRKLSPGHIIIPAPSVNHKAATVTDASAFRRVASNLDKNQYAGGSNVRAAVSSALRHIATALDGVVTP